jgi:hypothetical protein
VGEGRKREREVGGVEMEEELKKETREEVNGSISAFFMIIIN